MLRSLFHARSTVRTCGTPGGRAMGTSTKFTSETIPSPEHTPAKGDEKISYSANNDGAQKAEIVKRHGEGLSGSGTLDISTDKED